MDHAIPGLALLGEPPRLIETVSRLLAASLGPEAQIRDCRVTIRHLFPGKRCSTELELEVVPKTGASAERRRVLGKLYSDDQGARTYESLGDVRNHGFSAGGFTVPRPIAYDSDHQLLLLDWVVGESLRSHLLASSEADQRIEGAAAWLLRLHQCGVTSGRRYTVSRHVETLAGWMQQLTEVFPEGERLLADLLVAIRERGEAVSPWMPAPTHRDFTPEHLIVTEARLVGLDFDEFCQYDPLFDVAHFTTHLRFLGLTHFGALDRFDELADRFVTCYTAGAGSDCEERRRLYEAMTYVKLGRFVALVQRSGEWRHILPVLLREARGLV